MRLNWSKIFKKQRIPEAYQWYEDSFRPKELLKKKLSEARFVIVDCESTGLSPKKDKILSIGAVAVQNFSVNLKDTFSAEVKQDYFNNQSIAVHEITPGTSAQGREEKEVLHEFLEFLRGDVFIAHHANFDFQLISNALKHHRQFSLLNYMYDTMWMVSRVDDHFKHQTLVKSGEFKLESLCQRYHIPMDGAHTALGDAYATALLFARLLKKLEKGGVKNVSDLLKG
jgi:DNA polymerase-3 subunit epsilon